MGSSPYSFSPTTFDPTGRLQQVEFAFKAVERSKVTAAAIVAQDGIVVASAQADGAEAGLRGRRGRTNHVCLVTDRVVVAFAGMRADFQALSLHLQTMAIEHEREFGVEISCAGLAERIGGLMQEHTQSGGARVFGTTLLLAGCRDDCDPAEAFELFCIDPSGWVSPWRATAVGMHGDAVKIKVASRLAPTKKASKVANLDVKTAADFLRDMEELKGCQIATITLRDGAVRISQTPSVGDDDGADEAGDDDGAVDDVSAAADGGVPPADAADADAADDVKGSENDDGAGDDDDDDDFGENDFGENDPYGDDDADDDDDYDDYGAGDGADGARR